MIEERPPVAAPHTPSDDPRVLAQRACEQAVALVNRFYGPFTTPALVFAQGTNEAGDWRGIAKRAELDALTTTLRDLLARLDAAALARDDALARWLDGEIADIKGLYLAGSRAGAPIKDLYDADRYLTALRGMRTALPLREVRDRLGATTNTTPEEG